MPTRPASVITDHYFLVSVPGLAIGTFNSATASTWSSTSSSGPRAATTSSSTTSPAACATRTCSLTAGMTDNNALQEWFWETARAGPS